MELVKLEYTTLSMLAERTGFGEQVLYALADAGLLLRKQARGAFGASSVVLYAIPDMDAVKLAVAEVALSGRFTWPDKK